MVDVTSLLPELLATLVILVIKPFTLCKLAFMFGIRTLMIVIQTWVELLKTPISVPVNVAGRIFIWTIAVMSLPVRILMALQREKQLEMHLLSMQNEIENLLWDRKELESRLRRVVKERKIFESMLTELEEEHEKAIAKIQVLECELQHLRNEHLRLKEIQGKDLWGFRDEGIDDSPYRSIPEDSGIAYGITSWKPAYKETGAGLQHPMPHADAWSGDKNNKTQLLELINTGSKLSVPTPEKPPQGTDSVSSSGVNEILNRKRRVALSQSLFSAVLSLLIGVIVWQAEDPCMPLVVALFSVVGMSLKSVVQFFYTIKNKPATDAVALLSINWFILGTLTYPTLPRVARMFAPFMSRLMDQTFSWFWISST